MYNNTKMNRHIYIYVHMYHIKVQAQVSGLSCPLPKSTLRSLRGAWASRLGGSTQIPTIWPWGESPRNQIIHEALRMMILNHQEKKFLSAWRRLFRKLVYIFWSKGGFWDSDILDFIIPGCFHTDFSTIFWLQHCLGTNRIHRYWGFFKPPPISLQQIRQDWSHARSGRSNQKHAQNTGLEIKPKNLKSKKNLDLCYLYQFQLNSHPASLKFGRKSQGFATCSINPAWVTTLDKWFTTF